MSKVSEAFRATCAAILLIACIVSVWGFTAVLALLVIRVTMEWVSGLADATARRPDNQTEPRSKS
jgi:hypothetical protein